MDNVIAKTTDHTVRFYTDKGFVPSLNRGKNNKRLFNEESINWLTGKESGMSIEAIKEYVDSCLEGESTIPKRYEIFLEQQKKRMSS